LQQEAWTEINAMQKEFIEKGGAGWFVGSEDIFGSDLADFFLRLSRSNKYRYFGDFHCRLQHTCVSEAPAERRIKHAKRMITKHRYSTEASTVVVYMKASSRKDL
jgi:hypothetical protein